MSSGERSSKLDPIGSRLEWLDGMKGIAILWIVFFHFFVAYGEGRTPWLLSAGYYASYEETCAPHPPGPRAFCLSSTVLTAVAQLGFHGVGVFLVLSGFGLSYSLARTGRPRQGWPGWYRDRVVRLFPMYWVAHLVYLVSPFQAQLDPVDHRFLLSLLGDRVVPIETLFYYFNPALWYFGLLLQLYLVCPLLFAAVERFGVARFLVVVAVITFGARWVLLLAIPASPQWVQGGVFACRLWEFGVGMAAGVLWRRRPAAIGAVVLSRRGLLVGAVVYALGLGSYGSLWSYVFTDALVGTGLAVILAHVARGVSAIRWLGPAAIAVGASSYGLYLVHQPYVHYFGERMRSMDAAAFVPAAAGIIAVLALGAMTLERAVNRLTSEALRRLSGPRRE